MILTGQEIDAFIAAGLIELSLLAYFGFQKTLKMMGDTGNFTTAVIGLN